MRKPTKRPCKPRGTRGGDFWRLGILPCGAARNKLSGFARPLNQKEDIGELEKMEHYPNFRQILIISKVLGYDIQIHYSMLLLSDKSFQNE